MDEQRKRLTELLCECDSEYACEMADFLLEHGVLVPPCRVGDTVYIITDEYEIVEDEAYEMNYGMTVSHGLDWLYLVSDSGEDFYGCDVGKTVFLTREEAEAALKER